MTAAKSKINKLELANKQVHAELNMAKRQNRKLTKWAKAKDNVKHDLMLPDSDKEQ